MKYYILARFAGQKAGFWAVTSYYSYILHANSVKNVPSVPKNVLIYGLHHFGGIFGPLLMKYYILARFAGQKAGFWDVTSYYSYILHANSVKTFHQTQKRINIWFTSLWRGFWAVTDEILHLTRFAG